MRLTPIEIRQHRFNTRMRGFDTHEVEAFLETVVADFEDVVRENARLRRDAEKLAREVEELKGREHNIQETLTTAQSVVDQLRRTAIKEAEVLISEAEVRSEKLLQEAHAKHSDLRREITELRHVRNRMALELRNTIQGYESMIDAFDPGEELSGDGEPRGG